MEKRDKSEWSFEVRIRTSIHRNRCPILQILGEQKSPATGKTKTKRDKVICMRDLYLIYHPSMFHCVATWQPSFPDWFLVTFYHCEVLVNIRRSNGEEMTLSLSSLPFKSTFLYFWHPLYRISSSVLVLVCYTLSTVLKTGCPECPWWLLYWLFSTTCSMVPALTWQCPPWVPCLFCTPSHMAERCSWPLVTHHLFSSVSQT